MPNPVVTTRQGQLEGLIENGVYIFRGVPYAAPPVGELRWKAPRPAKSWKGIRAARQYAPAAPQNSPMPGEGGSQSEDCLYLNIYTPGTDKKKRPVLLRIHGGAFAMGSGSMPTLEGSGLAKRGDVVVVTINYRLGALGFLNLKEITGGKIPATGNEGLLDQAAALRWVKENIAAFGGNPDNVTVFGESAGAMSIVCLMVMPAAQGLFHKAIIESPVGSIARPLQWAVRTAEVFLQKAGIKASEFMKLRLLPARVILDIQNRLGEETELGATPFMPVADGKIIPLMPLEALAAGKAARIPVLTGSNLDEQKFFSLVDPAFKKMDMSALARLLSRTIQPEKVDLIIEAYRKSRQARGAAVTPPELYSAINSDVMFRQIALYITTSQHYNGAPAYNYLFEWNSPGAGGALGACHTLEIGFIFGNLEPKFHGSGPEAVRLSGQIQDAFSAFARSGKPATESLGKWPQYGAGRNVMILSENSRLVKSSL
jgi:para-nitrobenzyl esterase